tara:strand:+ start:289 stop:729 length:441 start_codon:yes stop_codon:yes gene_type:complete
MKFNPLLSLAAATAICTPSIFATPVNSQQADVEYTLFVVMTSHSVAGAEPEPTATAVAQQEVVINQDEVLSSMGIKAEEVDTISYEKRIALMNNLTNPMGESESLAVQAIPMLSLKGCKRAGEALKLAYTKPSSMLKTSYLCIADY